MLYFAGAAARRTGEIRATSSFRLDRNNTNPKDVTTDGVHLWVVNDSMSLDKVFRYTLAGKQDGSWSIDPANSRPTGLTVDPNHVNHVWIVDAGIDRVYQYDGAAERIDGQQSASAFFTLARTNGNPQGIADPLPGTASSDMSPFQREEIAVQALVIADANRDVFPAATAARGRSSSDADVANQHLATHRDRWNADRTLTEATAKPASGGASQAHDEALRQVVAESTDRLLEDSLDHLVTQWTKPKSNRGRRR